MRCLLDVLSGPLAVRSVVLERERAVVYLRLRTFGLAIMLDVLLHRGRARPTAASVAKDAARAPHATECDPAAIESGGTARR